ncbi:hypothetical protein HanRHA438_Chr01g0033541 [Helianthus annuus]|nr:hypothetical protein HanRHA438_Chr01g0033541 [Helianthus annuus]
MITNKPRKLKLNKNPKKVNVEDDNDFETSIKDLNTKRAENTKKRANTLTDEDDDDFKEPIKKIKPSKQDRQMDPTKSKQTINEAEPNRTEPRPYYAYYHEAISLRCSPSAFLDTIRQFTEAQIADVKSIGFGHVLDIKVNHISTHLGFWLLRNYDEQYSTLNIGNHKIRITRDSVYDVFVIRKGLNPVREKNKPQKGAIVEKNTATDGVETTIDGFKNQ